MRKIIFLVLISLILIFRSQCQKQGEDSTAEDSTARPVNLFVINDVDNKEANGTISTTVEELRENSPSLINDFTLIEINGAQPKIAFERICEAWDELIANNNGTGPDLVLDTTQSGFAAEIAQVFTAAVGVPTLSAQYGERKLLTHWEKITDDQKQYLIHINPPADLITNVIKVVVNQTEMENVVIFFDENFVMDMKNRTLLEYIEMRHVILRARNTKDEIERQLKKLIKMDFNNFFVLGSKETIFNYVDTSSSLNLTYPHYMWYSLTLDPNYSVENSGILSNNIILFAPDYKPNLKKNSKIANSGANIIMSEFYHDITWLGIKAMKSAIEQKKWPQNHRYMICNDYDLKNTPERKFNFLNQLISTANADKNTQISSKFYWDMENHDHHVNIPVNIYFTDMKSKGNESIGNWSTKVGSRITLKKGKFEVARRNYRVVTVINPPFVQYNEITEEWSGYCIDMLNGIAKFLNFDYTIYNVSEYGRIDSRKKWNGMVGELIKKDADIALGSLSITAERDRVIDFTIPYYKYVGISILMAKPKVQASLFKFLTVLERDVWLCILASYFFTSILMWVFDRYSPYSYQNNKDKYKDDDEKRVFDLKECLWFCMTSLTPQGGGEAPKNLSGRLVAATWWLFGFIIIASYTANLAAFLTVSRLETPIESLDDLSKQYKVQYAPLKDSEAYTYFKRMADIEYKFYDIWKDMSLNDSLPEIERAKLAVWDYPVSDKYTKIYEAMNEAQLPETTEEALDRVLGRRAEDYATEFAFIGDAAEIKYMAMTSCDLIMLKEEFSKKPYGIGVQEGSPLRQDLNRAILHLRKHLDLFEKLEIKWWEKNPAKKTDNCPKDHNQSDGINIDNIGGVFIVIIVGIFLACVTLTVEYVYYRYKRRRQIARLKSFPRRKVAWNTSSFRAFAYNKRSQAPREPPIDLRPRF